MRDDTTYGLTPERLARLLAIGVECVDTRDDTTPGPTPAELLREMLAGDLPLDPALPHSLPAVLNRPCDELAAVADRSMGDLLVNSTTDPVLFKTLRDYARGLVRRGGSKTKRAVATAIYYAAIASALVFHGDKITEHSCEKLRDAFAQLEQKPWIPVELKKVFQTAHVLCQERKGKAE